MPRAVAVNSRGDTIVAEYTLLDCVQMFSAGGKKLLRVIGHSGLGNGEFNRPQGGGGEGAGRIFVAHSCNHPHPIFLPSGKTLRTYAKTAPRPRDFHTP